MKKLLILVCALFALSATSFAQKTWQIGDIYDVDGVKGVVFAVTQDGEHGRIISLEQSEGSWNEANFWCSELGDGWRLPTMQELKMIYLLLRSSVDFNEGLIFSDAAPFITGDAYFYWSNNYDSVWSIDVHNGHTRRGGMLTYVCYVRAVFAF